MPELYNKTIREIAVEFPHIMRVFEEFKIDYCWGGGRSFDDACQFAGVAPHIVSKKIENELEQKVFGEDRVQIEADYISRPTCN